MSLIVSIIRQAFIFPLTITIGKVLIGIVIPIPAMPNGRDREGAARLEAFAKF